MKTVYILAVILCPVAPIASAAPLTSAFTYQGRLTESSNYTTGSYEFAFYLYDAATFGTQVGNGIFPAPLAVSNGLFTVHLDFGSEAFDGDARWLQVLVRTNGSPNPHTSLLPRQPLRPAPYATFSTTAATLTGTLPDSHLSPNVARLNTSQTFSGAPTFSASGPPFTVSSATKVPNLNADLLDGLDSSAFAPMAHHHDNSYWTLLGNSGTVPGLNSLGTTDNQAFELKVNGERVLRLEPTASSPNVIAGFNGNSVSSSVGGTINGGGVNNAPNGIHRGDFAVVGGGYSNVITTTGSGADPSYAVIGGGAENCACDAPYGTISGGANNRFSRGGSWSPHYATIGGGAMNDIGSHFGSTISGGMRNLITGYSSYSIIGGGEFNRVNHGEYVTISGGGRNAGSALGATIGGGTDNHIHGGDVGPNANYGTIGGGRQNVIEGLADHATIGGGSQNVIELSADYAVIGGGINNTVLHPKYFAPNAATIGGGSGNTASGHHAIIPGGLNNLATNQAFAAGTRAKADHTGAFLWADSQDIDFPSIAANEVALRASGGVRLITGGAGLTLDGIPVLSGTVTSAQLSDGAVTSLKLAASSVSSSSIVNSSISAEDVNGSSFDSTFWKVDGNGGTTPGIHFIGTTDNQPVELRINGQRALRLEPNAMSPNMIGGFAENSVSGAAGVTIGGGGRSAAPNIVTTNQFSGFLVPNYATISGGAANSILGGDFACISGGGGNSIDVSQIGASYAVIGGGLGNSIRDSLQSTIQGGEMNVIRGQGFQFRGDHSAIGGGERNIIEYSPHCHIGGGLLNRIDAAKIATIGGGEGNFIGGLCRWQTISGGERNTNTARGATISGGARNYIGGDCDWSTSAYYAAIGGGFGNFIEGLSYHSIIAGGRNNRIASMSSPNASEAAIGGGSEHRVVGPYGTIPGGQANFATNHCFAAGRRAKAVHEGSFVWGDSTDADVSSTLTNQFTARASGGARIFSEPTSTVGVQVLPGANAWSALSDRNAKEKLKPVDCAQVLEKVAALPITTWQLKSQPDSVRHIGPMAQDFKAAFAVGEDERFISTSDADGVAFAAIKGLHDALRTKDKQIDELQQRLEKLERLIAER